MTNSPRLLIALGLVGALALGTFAAATVIRPLAVSVDSSTGQGITVSATETTLIAPDQATVSIGVAISKSTIAEARAIAATTSTAVLAAVRKEGVADEFIKTTDISLYNAGTSGFCLPVVPGSLGAGGAGTDPGVPGTEPDSKANPSKEPAPAVIAPEPCATAFTFTQTWDVAIKDLDNTGAVIDAATKAGATSIGSVRFGLADRAGLEASTRLAALAAARVKAEAMAGAYGATLGTVISIAESDTNDGYPYGGRDTGALAPTPVSVGTLAISSTVTVTFDLD